jgi:hypothetical protein
MELHFSCHEDESECCIYFLIKETGLPVQNFDLLQPLMRILRQIINKGCNYVTNVCKYCKYKTFIHLNAEKTKSMNIY